MPVYIDCEHFVLSQEDVDTLFLCTQKHMHAQNIAVNLACVSRKEITRLNTTYRHKNSATNILTFSYGDPDEHDIALCMEVAEQEASDRKINIRDYVALLVVHALLHAVGMDHEQSDSEDKKTKQLEKVILSECGFVPTSLSDV